MTDDLPPHEPSPADAPAAPGPAASPRRAAGWRGLAARLRRRLGPHRFLLPSLGVTFAVLFWLVTFGSGALFGVEEYGQYYDAHARGLLAGRLDVPPDVIGAEAFDRDGRTYGYFGPAPALLHMVPATLFPAADGRWSRASLLLAAAVSIGSAYRLLLSAGRIVGGRAGPPPARDWPGRRAYGLFVVAVGLGSTLAFVVSRSFVYHEAIAWGAALALVCYDHVVRYLIGGRPVNLAAACAAAVLAFFSRGTSGAGAVAAVALLAAYLVVGGLRRPADARWRHAAAAGGTVAVTVGLFLAINYAKFRTPLEAAPLRLYRLVRNDPERMARTRGQLMSWRNLRTTAAAYASPGRFELDCGIPWVFPTWTTTVYPEAQIDQVEPFTGLPVIAPGLLLLAAAGLLAGGRLLATRAGDSPAGHPPVADVRAAVVIPTVAALAGGGLVLFADAVTHRYLHDFYPALVVCGAFGLHAVLAAPGRRGTAARRAVVAVGGVGVVVNLAVTVGFQRMLAGGIPREAEVSFRSLRALVSMATGCRDDHAGPPGYARRWRPPSALPAPPPGSPQPPTGPAGAPRR